MEEENIVENTVEINNDNNEVVTVEPEVIPEVKPKPKRASRAKPKIVKEAVIEEKQPEPIIEQQQPVEPTPEKPKPKPRPRPKPKPKPKPAPAPIETTPPPPPKEITREDVDNFLRNERIEKARRNQAKFSKLFSKAI
jgi:hypothetical protein